MKVSVRKLHKRFGDFTALNGVNLDIESGELLALLGPSGSGKTTLLRNIAGLDFPDYGQILFGGEDMASRAVRERRIGFVFQHYALFKHMTILDNVAFGLRVLDRKRRPDDASIRSRAIELLELVQLGGLEKRFPAQLSGGQRQRVALARALAIEPRVLLLDEPFGALDARVRKDLRQWLRELHRRTGYTTIFVTHDQEEALELADRVVIMNRGKIEQLGSVDQVYERPATPFVFQFLGNANVIPGELRGQSVLLGEHEFATAPHGIDGHGPVNLFIRPGDLRVTEGELPGFDVRVESVQKTGPIVRARTRRNSPDAQLIDVELPHLHHDVKLFLPGNRLRLRAMQYSIYARDPQDSELSSTLAAPFLSGRERERQVAA